MLNLATEIFLPLEDIKINNAVDASTAMALANLKKIPNKTVNVIITGDKRLPAVHGRWGAPSR